MKKIPRFLKSLFSPKYMQEIDMTDLLSAMNDAQTRQMWLHEIYQELRQMNLDVERALLDEDSCLIGLSSRRRAFQDVLEMILTAKKRRSEGKDPNPRHLSEIDLDRVTV